VTAFSGVVRVPSCRRSLVDLFKQALHGFPGSNLGSSVPSVEPAEHIAGR